jgi:4'-phosphopantetheinyl transferase
MQIRWFDESEAGVPSHDHWLSSNEIQWQSGFRFPKRRNEWRLGRWIAKCAVAASIDHSPAFSEIEVRPSPCGAPEVSYAGAPLPVSISISHRAGRACCALANGSLSIGCDLEVVEPRSPAFLSDYFTPEEECFLNQFPHVEQSRVATLLWSAKESALKALRTGLRADTRSVSVHMRGTGRPDWQPYTARHAGGVLYGWWCSVGQELRTVAASRRFVVSPMGVPESSLA